MIETDKFEQVEVASAAELRAWLEAHHAQAETVWLVTYKKQVADKYVSTAQVLDALIAYGWIDGIRRKLDDDRTMQLIAPRKTQAWAATYKARAERLEREGSMHEAGRQAIAESKRLGLWDVMVDVDALELPDDLVAALQAQPPAYAFFTGSAPSYRRNVLRWIKGAKTDATRAKRIAQTATTSAQQQKIPQM